MDYTFMPSLERLSLTRIATELWKQDIRSLLVNFNRSESSFEYHQKLEEWDKFENNVMEKVLQLPQPDPLKQKILGLIKPIGLLILNWINTHIDSFRGINLPNDLCWTPQGTIDAKRTAEVLIKDEQLEICSRYKMACLLCSEDDIRELWKEIPKMHQRLFYTKINPKRINQHELVVVWTYDMMGKLSKLNKRIENYWGELCSPYEHAFRCAIKDGNEAAIEHFLRKLTSAEKEECLVKSTAYVIQTYVHCLNPSKNFANTLCILLSQMNEKQQEELFKNFSCKLLHCFLHWPCQEFFIEMAKRMWTFLTEKSFEGLIGLIARKATFDYKDYDYRSILKEFWQQSAINHRKYVIHSLGSSSLLSDLFKIEDKENIKLILKDASTAERGKFIFSVEGKCLCESLLCNGKSDLLKFFIQECTSSKSSTFKFQGEFVKHMRDRIAYERLDGKEDMWSNLFQILDELTEKYVK